MNPHALIFDLNPSERKIFEIVSDAGDRLGIPVYAIGGFVVGIIEFIKKI